MQKAGEGGASQEEDTEVSVYLHKDFCWPYSHLVFPGTLWELGVSVTSEALVLPPQLACTHWAQNTTL